MPDIVKGVEEEMEATRGFSFEMELLRGRGGRGPTPIDAIASVGFVFVMDFARFNATVLTNVMSGLVLGRRDPSRCVIFIVFFVQ
jgi:hypothetical protein